MCFIPSYLRVLWWLYIKVGLATASHKTALAMGIFHVVIPDQFVYFFRSSGFISHKRMDVLSLRLHLHFSYCSSTSSCLFFSRVWKISCSLFDIMIYLRCGIQVARQASLYILENYYEAFGFLNPQKFNYCQHLRCWKLVSFVCNILVQLLLSA